MTVLPIPAMPMLGLGFGQDQILKRTPVNYCSLEQIKAYLHRLDLDLHGRGGDPDDELKMARAAVKRQVNMLIQTEFDYVRRAEWISGEANDTTFTRYYPIVDLEYVRMYNVDYQRFYQYSGLELITSNRAGIIQFPPMYITSNPFRAIGATLSGFHFFPGKKNIQIVYTSGRLNNELPDGFSEYVSQWCAGWILRGAHLRQTQGLKSAIISGVQENYGAYREMADVYIQEAKDALIRYRRIEIW